MNPYFKNRKLESRLEVICGRCERVVFITLKRRRDFPTFICPKCKVENRLKIVWK